MAYIVKMPKMGLEMEQGEVVSWEVDVDEPTERGDVIAVVESEKAANDVEAREDGVLRKIFVSEGGVVKPGDPIGIFAPPEEDIEDLVTEAEEMADGDEATASAESTESADEPSPDESTDSAEQVRATPGAKQRASEEGIELADIDGSGPQGTITEADVKQWVTDNGSTDKGSTEKSTGTSSDVRATPGAKQLAADSGVDLGAVEGTGPQGVITESDVEGHASESDAEETADVRATPGAKQLANERGVELATVNGTGPQGVIVESDVEDHATAETTAETAAVRTVSESRELTGMQQTISDRMSTSHRNAPHVTLNRSFDATTLLDVKAAAENEGVDVSLTDLLVSGVGAELEERPAFNALFEDGNHKLVEEVNIGIAVDIDGGLVTPVVPSVTKKSVEAVSEVRGTRTKRALDGDFKMSDMEGGTFTITNLGMLGVDSFDPIINPPEVAILGVGRVREDGTMTLSLSFDHRVVNGADAARFLDGAVTNLTDAKWLADQFDQDIVGSLLQLLSE